MKDDLATIIAETRRLHAESPYQGTGPFYAGNGRAFAVQGVNITVGNVLSEPQWNALDALRFVYVHAPSLCDAAEALQRECDEAQASERATAAENDALKAALLEHVIRCSASDDCDAPSTLVSGGIGLYRACDACAKRLPHLTWDEVPHAATIRLLGPR